MANTPPSPPSTPGSAVVTRNRKTMLPTSLGAWQTVVRSKALAPEDAYALALGTERAASVRTDHPYRLFVAGEDGTRSRSIDIGQHLVIGRHTECDVVLAGDVAISLRHVLVRVGVLDDGLPVLSLLDLDSGAGFELSNGARERAVVAVGPVVFRVGATSFVALPLQEIDRLPSTLEPPLVRQSDASSYRVNPHAAAIDESSPRRPTGRITIVPWSVRPRPIPARPPLSAVPSSERFGTPAAYEITLEQNDGTAIGIQVSPEDVGHGILLGRDDRCVDGGLQIVLKKAIGVSRVHVLVIQERDGVKLYDLASTNGTYDVAGERVRQSVLENRGTSVTLCGRGLSTVALHWRAIY